MAEIADTLQALADPSRRLLLQRLSHGPATSGQLASILTSSRPAASQHLAHLIRAGLVSVTSVGRNRWHELAPGALYELEHWLHELTEIWTAAPSLEVGHRRTDVIPQKVPPQQVTPQQKENP